MNPKDPALRLDDRFTHLVSVGDAVLLVGDEDGLLLESPVVGDVVRLVDGGRPATAIAEALADLHPPEWVHFVLLKMEREGLLHPVSRMGGVPRGPERPLEYDESERSLAGRLQATWAERGNREAVPFGPEAASCLGRTALLTDDYLLPELEERRAAAVPVGEPCLLVRLGPREVWVGPWILPGTTPCVFCLQERLRVNLMARAFLHASPKADTGSGARIERLEREIPLSVFLTLARALPGEDGPLRTPGRLRVLSTADAGENLHPVHRLPHCSQCGAGDVQPPGARIHLQPVPCASPSAGGYRSREPEETLSILEPLVSPLTGVVRYVRKVPVECAEQVHVYTASHAHSYHASNLRTLRSDRRDHSGGKGMADLDARVSAMCEAVERFSSIHRGTEEARVAHLSDLGPEGVHPNELLLFSESQYRERETWNAKQRGGLQWVPEPYQDELIEWSSARSLVSGETRWVPSAAVFLGFSGKGRRFCRGDSNGLASGNCLEEAILQGFLELAERDGVALWWYNRARVPAVDLGTFPDPRVAQMQALYPKLGRELWALDLTTDMAIPTFVAFSAKIDGSAEDIIFGFGAHLDAQISMLRALAELNQMLPTIERTPEERRRQLMPDFEDAIRWWETATIEGHPYLLPDPGCPATSFFDFGTPAFPDLLSAIDGSGDGHPGARPDPSGRRLSGGPDLGARTETFLEEAGAREVVCGAPSPRLDRHGPVGTRPESCVDVCMISFATRLVIN